MTNNKYDYYYNGKKYSQKELVDMFGTGLKKHREQWKPTEYGYKYTFKRGIHSGEIIEIHRITNKTKNKEIIDENIDFKNAEKINYNSSLYDFKKPVENIIAAQNIKGIFNEHLYYGEDKSLVVDYISDLHLDNHLQFYENEDEMIDNIVQKLLINLQGIRCIINFDKTNNQYNHIFIFCGDIANSKELTKKFYCSFMKEFNNKISKIKWELSIIMHNKGIKESDFSFEVYAVLGNHEYSDFYSKEECDEYYSKLFKELNVTFLNNNFMCLDHYCVFGGTGFAKYNDKYNSNTVLSYKSDNEEKERKQTAIFENEYYNALNFAINNNKRLICISHYPVSDCLNNKLNEKAVYFYGHDHHNFFIKSQKCTIYANNQIGYSNNNFSFKEVFLGYEINPYANVTDGLYLTSINDYSLFCHYNGTVLKKGSIRKILQSKYANLYMIKRCNIYAFFIVNDLGILILNGGRPKKITNCTDINWICDNFDIVLKKYYQGIVPLRKCQIQVSEELQQLGFWGTIHGCIVDIDYYNHIMFNPIDGSIKCYYSSQFGKIAYQHHLIEKIIKRSTTQNFVERNKLMKKYKKCSALNKIEQNCLSLLPSGNTQIQEENISRKEGIYGLSNKISALQRIFSDKTLRDFDITLTEIPQPKHRKCCYKGCTFWFNEILYIVISDSGTDIIEAVPFENQLESNLRKFSVVELKKKKIIFNKNVEIDIQKLLMDNDVT